MTLALALALRLTVAAGAAQPPPEAAPASLPEPAPQWTIDPGSGTRRTVLFLSAAPRLSLVRDPAGFELGAGGGVELPLWGEQLRARLTLPLRYVSARTSPDDTWSATAIGLSFIPAAALVASPLPKVDLYAEVGMGVAAYRARADVPFFGRVSSWGGGVEAGLALGAEYRVSPDLGLFLEPLAVRIHDAGPARATFGDTELVLGTSSTSTWALRLGVTFRP